MAESEKPASSPAPAPAWLSEPPERPWRGDWRLPDERADREVEVYYTRSRATNEEGK